MSKSFSLILTVPESDPVQYRLTAKRVTLGRTAENQITVNVSAVSSKHCEFRRSETGGYWLVDLGSTNGTRINGQKVMSPEGVALKNGDRISIGETVDAHFFEAIDAEAAKAAKRGGSQGPVSVWVDASAQGWHEEVINPVAAAVARQEAERSKHSLGHR